MKVRFLGTGQMGTVRKNTSFVVDDSILFDVGNGIVDALIENNLDTKDIDFIIISHFHADHYGDIVYYLYRRAAQKNTNKQLTIIGPSKVKEKVCMLYEYLMPDFVEDISKTMNINFIELQDNEVYKNQLFSLKAIKVIHGPTNCNGYIITKGKTSLGYSGDSSFCDSLINNISNADNWIIEANNLTEMKNYHIGLNQLEELAIQHKNKNFYAVHRKDYKTEGYINNIIFPSDGGVYELYSN